MEQKKNSIVQIYVRVSSDKQERYSPESQRTLLTDWAIRNGHLLLEPIIETGSGESIFGRPGIQKVMKLAQDRAFDILAVIEMERIARDESLQDALLIKSILRENGIKIATPSQMFDLEDVEDDFMSDLLSALSKRERRKIIQRSHRGRVTAKKSGAYLGEFLPYGYAVNRLTADSKVVSCIVFDDAEKKGLEQIVALAEKDYSSRQIAREMTRQGFPTKMGRTTWNKCVIVEILHSTWLYGEALFFRKKAKRIREKKEIIWYPEDQWVTYTVPALIDKQRWDVIQQNIAKRRLKPLTSTKHPYLFQGILRCMECYQLVKQRGIQKVYNIGTRTDWYNHTDLHGNTVKEARYPYYVCANRVRHEPDWPCDFPQMRSTIVDDRLWEETKTILKNPHLLKDAVKLSSLQDNSQKHENQKEVQNISNRLEKVKTERKRAVRNILTCDSISKEDFKEVLNDLDKEIEKLNSQLKKVQNVPANTPETPFPFEDLDAACTALSESIDGYDFDMKRELVQALYADIFLAKDYTVTMNGRIPLDDQGIEALKCADGSFTQYLAGVETSASRSKTARSRSRARSCRSPTPRASCSRSRSIPARAATTPTRATSVPAGRSRSRNTWAK